ncbi:MAG: hypothetical protein HY899_18235 [Deltaproteobacteria bacterium]|nr:hypothetical protein [Deltaproteobacteria bacterium]
MRCEKDTSLTDQEKEVFRGHLERERLSDRVWDLFGQWVARSTPQVRFFYLKAYLDAELVGLGLFLGVKPVDLRASYSGLRKGALVSKLAARLSALASNCLYVSFRNLITSNLTRPFFFRDPAMEPAIMQAFLAWLRDQAEADMAIIIDTVACDPIYQREGFRKYACPSEAYLDVTRYRDVSAYLAEHPSLRKNLRRAGGAVITSVRCGPLCGAEIEEARKCVECSVDHSRVNTPGQRFFEENIFTTEVFDSDEYVHVLVRVEDTIAGFHTFQVCGSHMGGVVGGFNRAYSRNNFLYERVILGSLDYALTEGITRVHYSLIDNHTKVRLVESREPCGFYFFSRNPLNRILFDLAYCYSDVHELSLLESHAD